jgi:hypothetical protein
LTFSNSSSAVIFPSTTANYGTGSFTVEMAFKPTFINGRHYLMSKNSGSFPNWAIYLSGSAGAGKLWSEFRISSTVSCSVSSSTTFVTGSVYQVDVRIASAFSASSIYVNGLTNSFGLGNNGGSLSNTASLFVGNFSQNDNQNFSGSIYAIKTYSQASTEQPVLNYNATSTRFSKPPVPETAKKRYEILVVAGGGSGGYNYGGGGGAGGVQYTTATDFIIGNNIVNVGAGGRGDLAFGENGSDSSILSIIAYGGGGGGSNTGNGLNGGSGGGSSNGGIAGLGTSGQGNDGGANASKGAGGGGAGTSGFPSNGGSGSYIASFAAIGGSPAGWFGGGGGGGAFSSPRGLGGIGGGGNSGDYSGNPSIAGVVNTGGGGGGGAVAGGRGQAGGSGIVAIRYNGTPIALGGEITQSAGFTYHVFRTVGTSSFAIF